MALCINQSGTWRNITTLCVNQSGTWRKTLLGCINQSGTWRGFIVPSLGSAFGGGYLICQSAGIRWVVAPASSEVVSDWPSRNAAVTNAQQVSGCTGWFIPNRFQLQNPGYVCRGYWDSYSTDPNVYWSSDVATPVFWPRAYWVKVGDNGCIQAVGQHYTAAARAFRCVTY